MSQSGRHFLNTTRKSLTRINERRIMRRRRWFGKDKHELADFIYESSIRV